jgi:hypothetical protein
VNRENNSDAQHRFVKRATLSTNKIDSLLKTLQVRPSPSEALVQAYLIHIADRSDANFRKILELKGIKKQEQNSLVDLFNAHCMAPNYVTLPAHSPFLTPLQLSTGASTAANLISNSSGGGGGMMMMALKDTSSAPGFQSAGRFDAATFGSALISVAREGVDRLGTPTLPLTLGGAGSGGVDSGGGAGAAVAASAGQQDGLGGGEVALAAATTNLNENLKSFGKFFRREGGFGRFGRGSNSQE